MDDSNEPYNRRNSDRHIERLEDRVIRLSEAISDVVRLDAEIRSVIARVNDIDDVLNRLDATIQTLNEARLNMMLMTKSVADNERDIVELKLEQTRQREKDRVWDWMVRVSIGVAGVVLTAWAFVSGKE